MSIPEFGHIKWRDTGRDVTIFGMDGRVAMLFSVWLYRPRMWTFALLISFVVLLVVLRRFGYTIPNALRYLRLFITGRRKPAHSRGRSRASDLQP